MVLEALDWLKSVFISLLQTVFTLYVNPLCLYSIEHGVPHVNLVSVCHFSVLCFQAIHKGNSPSVLLQSSVLVLKSN